MRQIGNLITAVGVGLGLALTVATASAQSYPTRTVRIVVPVAAGGGTDVLFRAIAQELAVKWDNPVVVDNRPGASGTIGTAEVVKNGGREGYTLLATTDDLIIHNRYVYRELPFDIDKDLVGITMIARADQTLIASHAFPANDIKELIAYARTPGNRVNFGSWGDASSPSLIYGMLNQLARTGIVGISYKGVAPVMNAIAANEVQLSVISGGTAAALLRAGKAKVLAAAAKERAAEFPNIPTTTEQGFPQLQAFILFGLMTPTGTSQAVIDKIGADMKDLLQTPAFVERHITSKGWRTMETGQPAFLAAIKERTPQVEAMVKAAGLQKK